MTASVEVVPENLVYFIDSGFADGKILCRMAGNQTEHGLKE